MFSPYGQTTLELTTSTTQHDAIDWYRWATVLLGIRHLFDDREPAVRRLAEALFRRSRRFYAGGR
jgi:hypothetical protein